MSTLPDSTLPETHVVPSPQAQTTEVPNAFATESSQTIDTAMLAEIMQEPPLWRRPGFAPAALAALVLGLGLYALNSEQPAQTISLEQPDEATFEDEKTSEDTVVQSDAKPEMIVPPNSSLYSDPGISKLAFAKEAQQEADKAEDSVAKSAEKPAEKVIAKAAPAQPATTPVRFAVNSTKLDQTTKLALDSAAKRLKADKSMKLRLEGHADERGTKLYNYRLGLARAKAAKSYLVKKGVPANRLSVVSFGKSRPASKGKGESTWAKNRRVELKQKSKVQLLTSAP